MSRILMIAFSIIVLRTCSEQPATVHISLNNSSQQQVTLSEQTQTQLQYNEKTSELIVPAQEALLCNSTIWQSCFLMAYINPYAYSWKTVSLGLLTCYISSILWLWRQAYTIQSNNFWSSWQDEIPISLMQEMEPNRRQEILLAAFKEKYGSYTLKALKQFAIDIKNERSKLEKFAKIMRWIKRLKLTLILPAYEQLILEIPLKMQRLDFVYHEMDRWIIKQLHNY